MILWNCVKFLLFSKFHIFQMKFWNMKTFSNKKQTFTNFRFIFWKFKNSTKYIQIAFILQAFQYCMYHFSTFSSKILQIFIFIIIEMFANFQEKIKFYSISLSLFFVHNQTSPTVWKKCFQSHNKNFSFSNFTVAHIWLMFSQFTCFFILYNLAHNSGNLWFNESK